MTTPSKKNSAERVAAYDSLGPQWKELLDDERDPIAAMANFSALIKETFGWHWVGFYRVVGAELVLGPFQGPVACSRIGFGKGVCGSAWKEERTLVVPDVGQFPGHIACSPHSRSEIVVPLRDSGGRVAAVLDIDSAVLDDFGTVDVHGLEALCETLQPLFE
ncbi:MAG: GAF domain-containing protein [Flavobacteriales bacterium]|jgi:GAF domain-containing protein|nr:GAF domain-containing protein [Flavobacteriales bacterium]